MWTRSSLAVFVTLGLISCGLDGPGAISEEATLDTVTGAAGGGLVVSASGAAHWTVPPEIFGSEVGNVLAFSALKRADGRVGGHILYIQEFQGSTFWFIANTTCINVYDGNRAKYGGVITHSNDPDFTPGFFIWFTGIDNGEGSGAPPDRSSISGFGDEAANEAFCNSPAPPRRVFDVQGNIQVSD